MSRDRIWALIKIIPKTIGNRKEIVREVARGDKPYLRKSTDRKAQTRKAFVQFSGLICALRSVNFLREGLSPRATSRTVSFSISISFCGTNIFCVSNICGTL